jgi:hypothetical protein
MAGVFFSKKNEERSEDSGQEEEEDGEKVQDCQTLLDTVA